MKQIKRVGVLTLLVALFALTNIGCRKKKDTIAEIMVRNSAGAAVSGATVYLYPKPSPGYENNPLLWEFETTTNSSGVASFNFNEVYQLGQAGVVVAHIKASQGGSSGTGVIKVEEETTSTATVFI
jgi:hypothetical protein